MLPVTSAEGLALGPDGVVPTSNFVSDEIYDIYAQRSFFIHLNPLSSRLEKRFPSVCSDISSIPRSVSNRSPGPGPTIAIDALGNAWFPGVDGHARSAPGGGQSQLHLQAEE